MSAFRSRQGNAAPFIDLLPPERSTGAKTSFAVRRAADIVDAEFEVVARNTRRTAHPVFNDNHRGTESVRTATSKAVKPAGTPGLGRFESLLQSASPSAFAILVTVLCAPVFLAFAMFSPQADAIAPPSPVLAVSTGTALKEAKGMKILSVHTSAGNRSEAPSAVPTRSVDIISGGQRHTIDKTP